MLSRSLIYLQRNVENWGILRYDLYLWLQFMAVFYDKFPGPEVMIFISMLNRIGHDIYHAHKRL